MQGVILKLVNGHHVAVPGEPKGHLSVCQSHTGACLGSFFTLTINCGHLIPPGSRWRHGRDQKHIKELQLKEMLAFTSWKAFVGIVHQQRSQNFIDLSPS